MYIYVYVLMYVDGCVWSSGNGPDTVVYIMMYTGVCGCMCRGRLFVLFKSIVGGFLDGISER
jgi:hypothetical protein